MTRKGVEVEKERVMSGIRKERPTGKRVIDEEGTDGDSCLKWYAGNPLSSHTHPVGDTREETVGNDRGGLRPVSPTGVEWVGSGTRPISSHSSRFLVSSLVPHSVPRNRLSFVEISPSQVKWRTEQTKDGGEWRVVREAREERWVTEEDWAVSRVFRGSSHRFLPSLPLSLPHILVSSHSLPSPLTHSVHRLSTFASSPRSLRVSYGMEWSVTRRGVKGRWRGGIRLETERDVERRDRRRPPPFPLHTAPYHLTTFCPPLGSFLITSHSIRSVSSCSVTHYILSHPSPSDRPFGPPFGSDGDGRGKDKLTRYRDKYTVLRLQYDKELVPL